jgi:hypothetical protein
MPLDVKRIAKVAPKQKNVEEQQEDSRGIVQKYAPSVVRGGAGFLGFTPLTGAAAGAGGEILAEMIEKGTINPFNVEPKRVAAEAAVGAAMGKYAKGLNALVKGSKTLAAGIRGATFGGAAPIIRHTIEDGDPNPLNYPGEVITSSTIGGVTGAGAAKILGPKIDSGNMSIDPRQVPTDVVPPVVTPPTPTISPYGARRWPLPVAPVKGKPRPIGAGAVDEAQQNAAQAAEPIAKRAAAQMVKSTRDSLKQAGLDTRPSTTTPTQPLTVNKVHEGKGFSVADAEEASVEDLANLVSYSPTKKGVSGLPLETWSASPEAASEATQAALAKTANPRMGPAQVTKARTEGNQAARQENAAELAQTRSELGGTDISKVQQGAAKAHESANKLIGKEKADAAKAQTKYVEDEAKREAANLNARDKFTRKVEVGRAQADAEQARMDVLARKSAQNAAKLQQIEDLKEGRVPTEPSVRESISAETPEGGRASSSRSWVKPAEEGGDDIPGGPSNPNPTNLTPEFVALNAFPTKMKALEALAAVGGKGEVRGLGKGKWRVIFPDESGQIPPDAPTPNGPSTPPAPKSDGGAATPTVALSKDDKVGISLMSFSNKVEANAMAKLSGGRVHQYGPRRYKVLFDDAPLTSEVPPVTGDLTPAPEPVVPTEPPVTKAVVMAPEPSVPVTNDVASLAKKAGLTPEEFRRYMDIRPGQGRRTTDAEFTEYKTLHKRIYGNGEAPSIRSPKDFDEVAERTGVTAGQSSKINPASEAKSPVEGVVAYSTGNKAPGKLAWSRKEFKPEAAKASAKSAKLAEAEAGTDNLESVLDAIHGKSDTVPALNPEGHGTLTVEEFARALAKEGNKPIAEVPLALSGETTPTPPATQMNMLGGPKRRGTTLSAMGGGQAGDILEMMRENPGFTAKLLGGLGGAAIGAGINEDDPLMGAIGGGAAGLAVGAGASKLPQLLNSGKTIRELTEPIVARAPNWIRGSLLSHPYSIGINSIAGPWGSQLMGGIEQFGKGMVNSDETQRAAGKAAISSAANLPKWREGFKGTLEEAASRIDDVEELGRYGQVYNPENPTIIDQLMQIPARWMLAGDLNARNFLTQAGLDEDTIRRITLTAEPRRAYTKAVANWGKSKESTMTQATLPFKRTAANILESGIERTPIIGTILNYFGDPALKIPYKEQLVQEGIGGVIFGAGYVAGAGIDPDNARAFKIHNLVSNLGGQYSLLANAGFAAGQAVKSGRATPDAVFNSVIQGMPVPSTQVLTESGKPFLKAMKGEEVPTRPDLLHMPGSGLIPDPLVPKVFGFAVEGAQSLMSKPPTGRAVRPLQPRRPTGRTQERQVRQPQPRRPRREGN